MKIIIYGFMMTWSLITIGMIAFANDNGINTFPLIIVFLMGYILIAIIGAGRSNGNKNTEH